MSETDDLYLIAATAVCEARNEWSEKHEERWLETDENHPDDFIGRAVVDAVIEARPVATDEGCVCKGNWRAILKEVGPLIGRKFKRAERGEYSGTYIFFGLVVGDDDYYYGMWRKKPEKMILASCVGSLKTHGYELMLE